MEEALELMRCAEINIKNLSDMVPRLANNPFFQIVKMQIEGSVKALETLEENK